MYRTPALAFLVALLSGLSGLAAEEPKPTPWIQIVIPIEIENDWNFRSQDPGNEHNQLYATIEPEATIGLFRGLSLYVHAVIEPVIDQSPREDRFFEGHGIFIEDLYLQYEANLGTVGANALGARVWGGKFTPGFGIAWDLAPGIYGTDFAEDGYEFSERWGFGGAFTLSGDRIGAHTFSASTFFVDTTPLSESLIQNRPRTRLTDGGPGNTEDLSSFNIALDGTRLPWLGDTTYHVGFIRQAVRGDNVSPQYGLAVGLQRGFGLSNDVTITPILEYVHLWNNDGTPGQRQHFFTSGVEVTYGPWVGSVSHTLRRTRPQGEGAEETRDTLVQVTGG